MLGLFTLFADRALDLHSWFIASLHMNARNGAWWLAVGRRANGFQCGVKEHLQDGAGCLDSDLGLSDCLGRSHGRELLEVFAAGIVEQRYALPP